jgi:hypothetical protein
LTPYSVALVDSAVLLLDTDVLELFLNRSFEETFASLATLHAVMKTRRFVTAHRTDTRLERVHWLLGGKIAAIWNSEKGVLAISDIHASSTILSNFRCCFKVC